MVEDRSNSDLPWDHNHYISPVCAKPYTRAKWFQEYTWSEKEGRHLARGYWAVVSKRKYILYLPFLLLLFFLLILLFFRETTCTRLRSALPWWRVWSCGRGVNGLVSPQACGRFLFFLFFVFFLFCFILF